MRMWIGATKKNGAYLNIWNRYSDTVVIGLRRWGKKLQNKEYVFDYKTVKRILNDLSRLGREDWAATVHIRQNDSSFDLICLLQWLGVFERLY